MTAVQMSEMRDIDIPPLHMISMPASKKSLQQSALLSQFSVERKVGQMPILMGFMELL